MEHLEGRQSILAALAAGQRRFQVILVRRGLHAEKFADVAAAAAARNVPLRTAERHELDAVAHGESHGGLVALCSAKPRMSPAALLDMVGRLRSPALLLLLEGIDDARNLGFTLRTAEALGAHAVLIKKHLWDFDAVEIARPASGAYERLPLVQVDDLSPLRDLQRLGVRVLGCLPKTRRTAHDVDLREPVVLAIGGEKRGLSGALRGVCDGFVRIPTVGGASSLSLSHAAAIVLAEAFRQRSATAKSVEARGEQEI